jgi:hypothetical protein
LSLTAVGFGSAILGGATPGQTIRLTNAGGVSMSIAGILTTGEFIQSNACPATLASLASCTINVQFSPLGIGARSGELQITTNASGSPHRLPLSGTGCRWFSQAQSRLFLTSCGN